MKKIIFTLYILTFCFTAFAQNGRPPQEDREKIQKAKIAFLTNRLDLSVDQAKLFWPIFTEYDSKKIELSHVYSQKKREIFAKSEDSRNMKEEDANTLLDIYLDQKQAELDVEKTYMKKFSEVLNSRQIWRMISFESDFRRSLIDRSMKHDDKEEPKRGGNRN
ncbi:hypothetical protein EV198_1155 [Roseivirga ehrenbergii]|uniref:Sensor of ECF-type sigma factor n=1 Tax=Roseivirga ehrenbergii (strain DSM 102268 / JCM 13514 / KCTC 12282 / NCIMB 14502 / KMM 6017) TaxID=279360 RepID=A0A150X6S2_ROSEK|nr:hypothetical protein [Roseivirga ehrenbergii]KYG74384.1 hypothetical protein MB14_04010 [Roseivirga ehrenbergii]TCL14315.1 hypothetical protein EV198_1155 [Roseivirga ehrenbergii]